MEKLEFWDWIQIISIIAAFVITTIPDFINIKKENGTLTRYGKFHFFILIAILFVLFISTRNGIEDEKQKTAKLLISASKNIESSYIIQDKINSSIQDLSKLQEQTKHISDSLANQLNLQRITYSGTQKLVSNLLEEERNRKINDSLKLYNVINQLSTITTETEFSTPVKIDSEDSLFYIQRYQSYISKLKSLMESQERNPFLLGNTQLLKIWSGTYQKLSSVYFMVNGYGLSSMSGLFNKVFDLNRNLRKLADFEQAQIRRKYEH